MSSINEYKKLRGSMLFSEVSMGYKTTHLFDIEELEKVQTGYSIDNQGNSLTGKKDGDWKENWIVIGYEDQCGDPMLIDINDEDLPVYTAMHGEGEWNPDLIASSFQNFIKALSLINEFLKAGKIRLSLRITPYRKKRKQ
jgi:hypothetical protein